MKPFKQEYRDKNFISTREFITWEYSPILKRLIIRSPSWVDSVGDKVPGYEWTLDIEFWGVEYINLPTKIVGIRLNEIKDTANIPHKLQSLAQGCFYFQIQSKGEKFSIVASKCVVGESSMFYSENRIIDESLEYEKILQSWLESNNI